MKLRTYKCPGCGAPLTVEEDKTVMTCEFCGQTVYLDEEEEERDRADTEEQDLISEEEKNERKRKRLLIAGLILVLSIVAISIAAVAYKIYNKPECDPFEYVSVEFSGKDGEGTAKITVNNKDGINIEKISYKLSQSSGLSEGDVVTVKAQSKYYRLTAETKQYEVKGLEQYLKDLAALSDEILNIIHWNSEEVNNSNLYLILLLYDDNEIISREPACMYLCTDGKQKSILYDITKMVVSTYEDTEKTVYLMVRYDGIIVRDSESKSFQYDSCTYVGNLIWLGEDMVNNGMIMGYESLESAEAEIRNTDGDMMIMKREMGGE